MEQLTIKAAVGSALLVISSMANANNINFTEAADAVIASELEPMIASFENDPNNEYRNLFDEIYTKYPAYIGSTGESMTDSLQRPVALSELSNSEVSFSNTNLGVYNLQIEQERGSSFLNMTYSNLVSYYQNGFTADFSQPVTNVSMDFGGYSLTTTDSSVLPYTPTTLNAIYRDALGQDIGSTTYTYGTGPYSGFSLDNSNPFSSIDISWDAGSRTIIDSANSSEASPTGMVERNVNNLLTADNFTYTQAVAVPEPETYAMMMAGLGMLGFTARRRKPNLTSDTEDTAVSG